ncbi:DUF2306 domain-containing protein [Brachybacterium sp. FME24]|uniref:DUF2306 domain-containing protein n=1 Tax=Brachybacterium sp. FME24 TaxID=2742605 RepID=UPI001867ED48|nr:DUF2306 domain-containing protein [Brachybacterium sp. FME24]
MDTIAPVTPVIVVHAVAALYVLMLGPFQILRRRRDRAHRLLGTTWVAAMLVVCFSSFGIMPGGFSWLHGLSIWTLLCLVFAIAAIRRGNVPTHRGFMVGSYLGTLGAFAFAALVPARLIPQLLRSEPLVVVTTVLAVGATVAVFALLALRAPAAEAARRESVS